MPREFILFGRWSTRKKQERVILLVFLVLLGLAFTQGYRTVHDLHWAFDPDFDRDISFARGLLEGNFGKDPNYADAYLWYNPLLFSIEAAIHRATGLPLNIIAARAGLYLNLLGPILFFLMISRLFDARTALASSLFYLFINSGVIRCWGAATYSPWLFPVCFNQFLFYAAIILCYKAYASQRYHWFLLLGIGIGVCFLGHTAPAVILILIMAGLHTENLFAASKQKDYQTVRRHLLQAAVAGTAFLVTAMPLLYYVIGKYRLHLINRETFEYTEGIFYAGNFLDLLKANINISLVFAIAGIVWFYRNVHNHLPRRILWLWLYVTLGMYTWSTIVAGMDHRFHIKLPGTVPSFHYFFYFKALESIFSGFGFLYLTRPLHSSMHLPAAILASALLYYPFYRTRPDFVLGRSEALSKEKQKDDIQVYNFIVENIPSDKVVLCEWEASTFPLMPTGRKMVCNNITFSNPYLDFYKRDSDRVAMLTFLGTGQPPTSLKLFADYNVAFALISNRKLDRYTSHSPPLGKAVFKNDTYSLFTIDPQSPSRAATINDNR